MTPHHAVMIVDVQRAFEPPPAFVDKVRRYSRRFHYRVFTKFLNPSDSMFRRVLKQKSCSPGSADRDLLIVPEPHDLVFDKASYGLKPFHLRQLKARGINHLTICGLDTEACVMGVMFSLFDAGIICNLKENMCWSATRLHVPAVKIIRTLFPETH